MSSLKYRPEIDGLRAIAVIPVILFHMDFEWLGGGFIGVDVFFVISGFLITSILMKELQAGTFSFRDFWARRIRRILPAMLFVTCCTLAAAYFFLFKPDQPVIGKQAIAALLSVANIYFWQTTGNYWGPRADDSPFLHAWSLSVEEQFYLFFPIIMWGLFRFRFRRLKSLMMMAIALSLAVFLWGVAAHPTATFYLLPSRAWELGIGCWLAMVVSANPKPIPDSRSHSYSWLALCGLSLVFASYFLVTKLSGGVALGVLGAALVIAFGQTGITHTLLSHRPIVHVGKISYSMYLWHWPVLVFADYFESSYPKILLIIPIYLFSLVSYHFVERPTRRRKGVVPATLACLLLTIAFAGVLAFSSNKYDTSGFARPHTFGLYYDLKPGDDVRNALRRFLSDMDAPECIAPKDAYKEGGIFVGPDEGNPRIVVLGDSHGVMWADIVRSTAEELKVKASLISMNGVSPFWKLPLTKEQGTRFLSGEKTYEYNKSRRELIQAWQPDLVLVVQRWAGRDESDCMDLLDFLAENAGTTLLIEQLPDLANVGDRNALQYLAFRGITPEPGVRKYLPVGSVEEVERGRQLIRQLAAKYPRCDIVPIYDLYMKDSKVFVLDGDQVLYVDNDHLTTYGTQFAAPRIERAIRDALGVNTEPPKHAN